MSRIVLLAPGDVITQCQEIISARGIKTKVIGNIEGSESKQKQSNQKQIQTGDKTSGSRELLLHKDDDQSRISRSGAWEGSVNNGMVHKNDTDGTNKGVPVHGVCSDNPGRHQRDTMARTDKLPVQTTITRMPVLLDKTKAETPNTKAPEERGGNNGTDTRTGTEGEKAANISRGGEGGGTQHFYLLTEEAKNLLEDKYDMELRLANDKITFGSDDVIIELGSQLIKRFGLMNETREEQSDAIKRLKRLQGKVNIKKAGNNGLSKQLKVVKVDSEKGLQELLNVRGNGKDKKYDNVVPMTRVTLISNALDDVDRAHAIFTAPTGDTNWKRVARAATARPNIRAYSFDPGGGDSLLESFAALLDAL
uniref:VP6 n=1 Tax=CHeRI orbivirus 3-4 TaxID=2729576 RepID=A0A6M3SXS8_9REOV|nr:VP6 [CHeRI orbivirus 3-4]